MNFLAHLFLSSHSEEEMIGNFIADRVKGKDHLNYPKKISEGILLHRQIDGFTDTNPTVMEAKVKLRPDYHKYSPVIMDVFMDHFLAVDFDRYSSVSLEYFAEKVFNTMEKYQSILPDRIQRMIPYMVSQNWLVTYKDVEGIKRILSAMSVRIKSSIRMEGSVNQLIADYDFFHQNFREFFPELAIFVRAQNGNNVIENHVFYWNNPKNY